MRAAVISFTGRGSRLNRRIAEVMTQAGWDCQGGVQEKFSEGGDGLQVLRESLGEWTKQAFGGCQAVIFVGACGIAVRAIAPWVRDKLRDPAVLSVDEGGRFVIPLLSGHVGGANRLAADLAAALDAVPVITTATDINGRFAVDVLGAENGCVLSDRELAKQVSAGVLAGETAELFSDFPVDGNLPAGVKLAGTGEDLSRMKPDRLAVWITWSSRSSERVLRLIPRAVVLGMGCRRGIPASQLEAEALAALEEGGVDRRAVRAIASADLKKEEEGLKELARMWNVPFLTFSREAMERIPGPFSSSEFVRQTAGVDCVCERAAMAAVLERKNGGFLLAGKRKGRGTTTALAAEFIRIQTGEQK